MSWNSYTIRPVMQKKWLELFAKVEHSHLVQSWPYGEAKKSMGWRPRRLVIERGDEPVAVCQVLISNPLENSPVASRISRGPLLLCPEEPDVEGIYRALRQHIGGLLLIAPALTDEVEPFAVAPSCGLSHVAAKRMEFRTFGPATD